MSDIKKHELSPAEVRQELQFKPCNRIDVGMGSAAGTHYAYPGTSIPAYDGNRFIMTCSSTWVVFMIGKKAYMQDTGRFARDVAVGNVTILPAIRSRIWIDLHRYLMYGLAAGVGGIAPWILFAGDVATSLPKGTSVRDLVRMLGEGVVAILAARRALKAIAPTLYDKLLISFLVSTGENIPRVTTATDVIKLFGSIVGSVWKQSFTSRVRFWKIFVISAVKVLTRLIGMIPRAAARAARVQVDRVRALIAYLQQLGVSISKRERTTIQKELTTSPNEIRDVLVNLRSELQPIADAFK